MRIFVFGATGYIGRILVGTLLEKGPTVDILTRDISRAEEMFGTEVNCYKGDMLCHDYPKLSKYDVVINCVGEIHDESLMRNLHVNAVRYALNTLSRGSKTLWIHLVA